MIIYGDSFGWEESTLWDRAKVDISLLKQFLQVVTLWWRLWSSLVGGGCGRGFHKAGCATCTSIHCIQENLSNNVKLPWPLPLPPTDIVHVAKETALLHKSFWFFLSLNWRSSKKIARAFQGWYDVPICSDGIQSLKCFCHLLQGQRVAKVGITRNAMWHLLYGCIPDIPKIFYSWPGWRWR